jgi:uncharacterized protein YbaR (Trm112 family)
MEDAPAGIKKVDVADELRACPGCEYQRGFHVSFVRQEEQTDALRLVLICPGCGDRFDIGKSI